MPDRVIFHADCNNFFASCECLERPELKDVPMAVAGDPESRVGVVVAKNELAKRYGVKTTDTVYAARKKCPDIVFVPPRHHYYSVISRRVNEIYLRYTDYVEPASIDESYLDMTAAVRALKREPRDLADELRRRVREEIGITISVGVSYCKIFAKMGSDYKKPDATTIISRENYRDLLWPLPVSNLLFAGKASVAAMNKRYIFTIGDLASQTLETMHGILGKQGDMLWRYANGIDDEPVRVFGDRPEIKSVSRGRTYRRDLTTAAEIRTVTASPLKLSLRSARATSSASTLSAVQIRRPDMSIISRQTTLNRPTFLQLEIQETAFELVETHWHIGDPIRALTVGVGKLTHADEVVEQMSLFDALPGSGRRERQEKLESLLDDLRGKYGESSITLGYQENRDIGIIRGEGRR